MRLTIISDTHGEHDILGRLSGDVLIHCGDMFNMFSQSDEDFERMDAWFGKQDFDLILCTGGNHDFELQKRSSYAGDPFENAVYLEGRSHEHEGVRRLASEGCRPRLPWAMNLPAFQADPTPLLPLLIIGSALFGLAMGGGAIAWSLWVTKLAPAEKTADYMSVHTFLTGFRGIIGPQVAFLLLGGLSFVAIGRLGALMILISIAMLVPLIKRFQNREHA